jgi:hypothetical protein
MASTIQAARCRSPLRRTARATWPRYRSSATSESAHPARPRMPFPGHAPDPETCMGSTSLLHTAADSRDLFRAISEPPGQGQRRGERCGDAGVRQAHDACSREVASTRVRCRRARLGRAAEAQVEAAALPRQRQLRRAARPQLTAPSDRLQASSRFGRDPSCTSRPLLAGLPLSLPAVAHTTGSKPQDRRRWSCGTPPRGPALVSNRVSNGPRAPDG